MDRPAIQDLIQSLNDLELACLTCLVADQHCIIRAPEDILDDVANELESISSSAFGFSCAVLSCTPETSLEEFCGNVIDSNDVDVDDEAQSRGPASSVQFQSSRSTSQPTTNILDSRKVTNVVIAKNLDQTTRNVQIQALELMRSKRIYAGTSVHATPKRFLFICLISSTLAGPPYLTPFLNDSFFISHAHVPHDSSDANSQTDTASVLSFSSIVRKPSATARRPVIPSHRQVIPDSTITHLQKLASVVRTTPEMRRYIHNIPTFLRLHRAVAGGVSALATRHLYLLARSASPSISISNGTSLPFIKDKKPSQRYSCFRNANISMLHRVLASLHDQTYTTPLLVPLAAEKVFGHRMELVKHAQGERSMLWGSSETAVEEYLAQVRSEMGVIGVLREVMDNVVAPL